MAKFLKTTCAGMILSLCLGLAAASAGDDLYVHIDDQGVYHFTDAPTSSKYVKARTFSDGQPPRLIQDRYTGVIRNFSQKHGLRPELVQAVIHVESGFNPKAVSKKGARGLMQVMPVHLQRLGIENPFNPRENIAAGTRYLSRLLERYDGNLTLSLAAYNAGPTAVDHYQDVPPYLETRQYVQKVLLYYRHYRKSPE